jgi:hypothetical protein
MRSAEVVGVHPVGAEERCHLIEMTIFDPDREFNVNDLTQVNEKLERSYWQAAYDESYLDPRTLQPLGFDRPDLKEYRLAFFFHNLDLAKPLESNFGPLALPHPSFRPEHLKFMNYYPP